VFFSGTQVLRGKAAFAEGWKQWFLASAHRFPESWITSKSWPLAILR
jgi:hypothetical protein